MFFRAKKSGPRTYLQIVESFREGKRVRQRVLATLGRIEDLQESGQLARLLESGARFEEINVGGLHYRPNTEEILPYVFLSEQDKGLLRELVKQGVTLTAQDIPGNTPTIINSKVV